MYRPAQSLTIMNRKLKITELNRISTEEFKEAEKLPLVVVLDNIRSLHNIGSVFRTSDAFRIECIYLCGITATPPHAEMHKMTLDKNRKYAIVMGNEVKGVQQEVIDHSHGCIEIPQYGTKHSLNVSVTAGIVIWDLFNKLK